MLTGQPVDRVQIGVDGTEFTYSFDASGSEHQL
jgi:hypothetical protein